MSWALSTAAIEAKAHPQPQVLPAFLTGVTLPAATQSMEILVVLLKVCSSLRLLFTGTEDRHCETNYC
jgi:hypothetical protein